MVTRQLSSRWTQRRSGFLLAELIIAVAILGVALLPLSYAFLRERQLAQAGYFRSVAMEIVDGEMEILAAGEWQSFPVGSHPYKVQAQSAANLPPGQFVLTRSADLVRLEWRPGKRGLGGPVTREMRIP